MMKMIILMFFLFLILFSMNFHYLSFLIGMEFLVISILYMIVLNKINLWFYLVYMVFSVSEVVLGLSLLVSMNFEYGHQKLMLLNLM